MDDFVDQAALLDQPTLTLGNCESCFLAEGVLNVGLAILCEECAIEHAWDRFLSALVQPSRPRKHRRTWADM